MVRRSLDACLKGETEEWVCEHRYRRANTDPEVWEWVYENGYISRRTAGGRPLEMMGTTMNIHERKLLELDTLASKEAAEEALKVKGDFLSVMSHEIRTPLNGICGMAELLSEELENDRFKDYIGVLTSCSHSLLSLINGILDYSKAESGKLELDSRDCCIEDLLGTVLKISTSAANEKNIQIKTNFNLTEKVFSLDDLRLRQVLVNIIGNAIKFSENGGEVLIAVTNEPENPNQLNFSISDNGVGINPEFMDHLYDPFSQQDGSNTRKFGGVGLGLSISKELVELMGGQIRIESDEGAGTTVSFDIQVAPGSKTEEPQKEGERRGRETENLTPLAKQTGKKILVVDDDQSNLMVLQKMVNQYGYEAQGVPSLSAAVALLKAEPGFTAALLDLHMPDGNGFELLKAIRTGKTGEQNKDMPVYACTADASLETREKVDDSSFSGRLIKPVRLKEIREALEKIDLERDSTNR
jgi:signal transduction histidine kinase/CheY-like chemotaxis protein